MELDISKAGRVYGLSGVAWEQDGHFFNALGEELIRGESGEYELKEEPEIVIDMADETAEIKELKVTEKEIIPEVASPGEIEKAWEGKAEEKEPKIDIDFNRYVSRKKAEDALDALNVPYSVSDNRNTLIKLLKDELKRRASA